MCKFTKHLNTNGSVVYWLPPAFASLQNPHLLWWRHLCGQSRRIGASVFD